MNPGGGVMRALTQDEQIQKEVVGTLLSLVEEPLGISYSRMAGRSSLSLPPTHPPTHV